MAATISASACSVPSTLICPQRRRFKKKTTNHVGKLNSGCNVCIALRYESEEIADYAIKLFSGIVTLYNRTIRFALSGQDKNAQNSSMTTTPLSSRKSRSDTHAKPPPPGVTLEINGYETRLNVTNYDYSRRVFGATLDSISRSRSGRYNSSNRHY
ncbi:RRM domain-containing protein [Citrus sinensis]|nr:RRM domain-containing protein [Citrus sinensis]